MEACTIDTLELSVEDGGKSDGEGRRWLDL